MVGDIMKSVFLLVVTILILVTNGGLLVIITKSREIRNDAATPVLLSLTLSDFMRGATFGIISTILSFQGATKDTVNQGLAKFHTFSLLYTRLASLFLVAALAAVKMFTIVMPLRATQLLTKKVVYTIMLIAWMIPLPVTLAAFFEPVEYSYLFKDSYFTNRKTWGVAMTGHISAALIIFIGSYLVIFVCIVKQYINMRKMTVPMDGQRPALNPILAAFKSARGIIALCTVYMTLYLCALSITYGTKQTLEAKFVTYRVFDSVTFLNVFVYVAFCKAARLELKKMVSWIRGRLGGTENSTVNSTTRNLTNTGPN